MCMHALVREDVHKTAKQCSVLTEGGPLSQSKPLGCVIARVYCLCTFKTQKKREERFQQGANLILIESHTVKGT